MQLNCVALLSEVYTEYWNLHGSSVAILVHKRYKAEKQDKFECLISDVSFCGLLTFESSKTNIL